MAVEQKWYIWVTGKASQFDTYHLVVDRATATGHLVPARNLAGEPFYFSSYCLAQRYLEQILKYPSFVGEHLSAAWWELHTRAAPPPAQSPPSPH